MLVSSSNLTPAVRAGTTIFGFHNGASLGKTPVVARFEVHEQSASFAMASRSRSSANAVRARARLCYTCPPVLVCRYPITANVRAGDAAAVRLGVFVVAVTHEVADSTITIRLNVAPNKNTSVGCFVLEQPPAA